MESVPRRPDGCATTSHPSSRRAKARDARPLWLSAGQSPRRVRTTQVSADRCPGTTIASQNSGADPQDPRPAKWGDAIDRGPPLPDPLLAARPRANSWLNSKALLLRRRSQEARSISSESPRHATKGKLIGAEPREP